MAGHCAISSSAARVVQASKVIQVIADGDANAAAGWPLGMKNPFMFEVPDPRLRTQDRRMVRGPRPPAWMAVQPTPAGG